MRRILILAVATLLITSLFAPAVTLADSGDVPVDRSTTIDSDLEESNSQHVEVLVNVEEIPPIFLQTGVDENVSDRLKSHAEYSQKPVKQYAKERDGVEVVNSFWITNAVVLKLDTEQVDLGELMQIEGVEHLEENKEVEITQTTTETDSVTYGLNQVNAPDTWDEFDTRGDGVKVAVLDTGVDIEHPDIDLYTEDPDDETYPGGWAEFDSSGNEVIGSEPHDTQGHGTHVAGTVAGGDNSGEYIGVAPEADMMHGLVLPDGSGSTSQILGGMEWAVEEDADIISMSLGSDGYTTSYIEGVENAKEAGTVVISSSGNDGDGTTSSPGNIYDVISVGATDDNEDIADFSSGEIVDTENAWGDATLDHWPEEYTVPRVSAPGVSVKSASDGGGYQRLSGTSMAAPHVAGAVALMISENEQFYDPETTTEILEETAYGSDEQDTRYGHGIIDTRAAMLESQTNSEIVGQVVNPDGEPIGDAEIEVTKGEHVATNVTGEYISQVVDGEREVTVSAFGYEPITTTVEIEEGETVVEEFTLERIFDANLASQDERVVKGELATTEFEAKFIEEVTVELHENSTVDQDDLSLHINQKPYGFDKKKIFGDPILKEDFTIGVESTEDAEGTIELVIHFERTGDEKVIQTQEIELRNPITIKGTHDDSYTYVDALRVNDDLYEIDKELSAEDEVTVPIQTDLNDVNEVSVYTHDGTEADTVDVTFLPERSYWSVDVYHGEDPYPHYTYGSPLTIENMESGETYTFELSGSGGIIPSSDDGIITTILGLSLWIQLAGVAVLGFGGWRVWEWYSWRRYT